MPPKSDRKTGTPTVPNNSRTSQRLGHSSTGIPKPPLGSPIPNSKISPENSSKQMVENEELNIDRLEENPKTPQKKTVKKNCPCGKSSGGQSWLLTCLDCNQAWHQSCAGLKADLSKAAVDSLLKTWQCPWCYICPFTRPDTHISLKNAQNVKENVVIASTIQRITEVMSEQNEQLSVLIRNLEGRLSSVNSDIDVIRGTQDLISQKVLSLADIEAHIQHQLLSQSSLDQKMKSMQSVLAKIQEEMSEFSKTDTVSAQPTSQITSLTSSPAPPVAACHNFTRKKQYQTSQKIL